MPAPLPVPHVEPSRLLWRTRGEHWDYEFICVPEVPSLPAWLTTLEAMVGDADAAAEELRYGLLEIDELGAPAPRAFPYVATRFLDPARKDWTGRPIQHFAAWFPPIPPEAVEVLPSVIPVDWHLRILAGLARTYGSGEVFGLPEGAIRAWKRSHQESRAAAAMTIVRSTPPMDLLAGDAAPARWRRVPTLKKKPQEPRVEVSRREVGGCLSAAGRILACVAACGFLLFALHQLASCGATLTGTPFGASQVGSRSF
ncbi:hypothetical protein SOCE26_039260 [Sorangium cellulosum]|uniref:Uncharacterized protein n=1 Tax=Sorangium cellulosum TaxID=56 RepID=A0A2L0ET76_SORCE|nr:hypothetical protein [Sorangium cellulosum]AUX42493.1 hypothetical protein SOCE26_039260 [Sorangium cellulosum]